MKDIAGNDEIEMESSIEKLAVVSDLRTFKSAAPALWSVGEVAMVTAPALPAHLPMSAARKVAELKKSSLVLVERDGRLVGVVDDVALLQAPDEARLEDAMERLEVCLTPATPLARAREQFARTGAAALPVAAGAFLLGAVTRAAVERAWRERQRVDLSQARPAPGRGRHADVPGADTGPTRHAA